MSPRFACSTLAVILFLCALTSCSSTHSTCRVHLEPQGRLEVRGGGGLATIDNRGPGAVTVMKVADEIGVLDEALVRSQTSMALSVEKATDLVVVNESDAEALFHLTWRP